MQSSARASWGPAISHRKRLVSLGGGVSLVPSEWSLRFGQGVLALRDFQHVAELKQDIFRAIQTVRSTQQVDGDFRFFLPSGLGPAGPMDFDPREVRERQRPWTTGPCFDLLQTFGKRSWGRAGDAWRADVRRGVGVIVSDHLQQAEPVGRIGPGLKDDCRRKGPFSWDANREKVRPQSPQPVQ